MRAMDLILKLRSCGYSIKAEGSYIDICPTDTLSEEFVHELKLGKTEILCALEQEEELIRLISLVSYYHNFREEDYQEALEVALTDPVEALICFRSLAKKTGLL